MTTSKIAIIGAGPAGCMLARLLSLSKISVTVYESDESPNYRSQGGTLDLHPETGLAAIKEAQLWDEYLKEARFDGQYMLFCDQNLRKFVEVSAGDAKHIGERPEIDRFHLRRILTESLPEDTVKWGHRLKRVEEGGRLVFEHTTESGFDLVVGCEGAWSKVRNFIAPTVEPRYTGIGYHDLSIPDAETMAPAVYKYVNRGSVFAHSTGRQVSVQQMGDGSIRVGCSSVRSEDWMRTCGYDPRDLEQTKKALLAEMHDYCPQLREAVEKTQGACEPRTLFQLPVGWRWEHRRGVTIIGDAAHLMTPFAGEGVNVALDDARKLAASIARSVRAGDGGDADELDRQVRAFEDEMFPRMERYQRQTDEVKQLWLFTEGDVSKVVPKVMVSHMRMVLPAVVIPLVSVLAHLWWWFVNMRLFG
ncbi:Uu.00g073600.m01.CDS01 [Anthostomella pinea]|uniref:Uu.00g073600.m01.CDS01 n=1 Tax=Anthostomella pinea TaxID=933095 RepID=A0AAI8YP06_9PEZI|nr:Uu.00g073600.m01.CDS01 [Anthostomella pinea]